MKIYCDNKFAISIAHDSMQHDRIKHIEVGWHFIKEKLDSGLIFTSYIPSESQLAGVLTKRLNSQIFHKLPAKLGMDNVYLLV